MTKVTIEVSFPMGHRLKSHPGRCRHMHGHTYHVHATFGAEQLDTQGMVADFKVLKQVMHKVLDDYDHAFVIEVGDPLCNTPTADEDRVYVVPFPPTAENLASFWFMQLDAQVRHDAKLLRLEVFESASTSAIVEAP